VADPQSAGAAVSPAAWPPALDAADDRLGLADHLSLYRRLIGARARAQWQYKTSLLLLALGNLTATATDFLAVVVLFGRIPSLAGWTLGEVALIYGLALAAFGLAEVFSRGFDMFHVQVLQGSFDRVLTRPLGAFFQVLASDVSLRKLSRVAQGLVIVALAQRAIPIHWTAAKVAVVGLALLGGSGIFFAIFVLGAASAFWTVQANEAVNVFTNGGVTMLSYPLDIYQDWLRRFATFVVPLAFVSYYPALYLLDRPDPLGLPRWAGALSPLAALLFGLVAAAAWSAGVRHYQSTGS
jgi:ABC-2 type transport system permease protein